MRVGILTDVLDRANWGTGVPSYGRNLIKSLPRKNICLVHYNKSEDEIYKEKEEVIVDTSGILLPGKLKKIWASIFRIPNKFKKENISVVHLLAPTFLEVLSILRCEAKVIVTVHDIHQFVLKKKVSSISDIKREIKDKLFIVLCKIMKGSVDRYIAVSKNTKKDLIRYLSVPADKIEVIYIATNKKTDKKEPTKLIKDPYILAFPPSVEILKIFYDLKERGLSEKLVIFGRVPRKLEVDMRNFIKENRLSEEVIFTGYISKEEIVSLYNSAIVFVAHVIYEGFGLPPLEAMACGCPVIASDVSSVPEVVNSAGVLVEPYKKEKWTKAIYQILRDDKMRKDLRKRGYIQASKFSWEKTASGTLNVYSNII